MKRRKIPALWLFIIMLSSCSQDQAKVYKGKKIDPAIRHVIAEKITDLFGAIEHKNPDVIKRMILPGEDYASLNPIDTITKYISANANRNLSYPVGEFLIENNCTHPIKSVVSDIGQYYYAFSFNPFKTDIYVYLFAIPDTTAQNETLVSTVFVKYRGEWCLSYIFAHVYMVERKIAPYWLEQAKRYYYAGWKVPAAYYGAVMSQIALPANRNFIYSDLEEMNDFIKGVGFGNHDLFPFPFEVATTGPKTLIVSLYPILENGKLTPVIECQTYLSLRDSIAVIKENKVVQQKINDIMPHIHDIGDSLIYRIYNIKDSIRFKEIKVKQEKQA